LHGTVSGSCPVTGFSISGDEPTGSATRELFDHVGLDAHLCRFRFTGEMPLHVTCNVK
jgi:hypothetical protein